MILTIIINMIF